jgi:hypothetical protein
VGSGINARQPELWANPLGVILLQTSFFAELTSYCHGCNGARHRRLQLRWWPLPDLSAAALGGPPSTSPTPMVAAAVPASSTPRGPPSTLPTPMMDATGPVDSTSQGTRHQRLQLWWWPLLDLPVAPPGGPPSTSPTPVVAAAGPAGSTPQGASHQRHQLRWWPLPDLSAAPPRGPAIDVSLNLVPATIIFLATPTRGATAVNNTAMRKKKSCPCGAKNPGVVIPLQKSPNQRTA